MNTNESGLYLITGGTGGIGFATARRLVTGGKAVCLAARNAERLESCAREIGSESVVMDVTDPTSIALGLNGLLQGGRRLAGVAHCVGSILLKPAHLVSDAEWNAVLQVNLTSSFYLLREVSRRMMSSGGSIVFCSTVAAQRGLFNHEAIAAAKAGLEGMARAAASTYARYKIRVNCVAPGLVRTPLSQSITSSDTALKISQAMHPLGRIGESDEVASAISWLLDPQQGWVTGQVIAVDGGMSTVQPR
jgi:NAD(P)-dependent dehydrogenase (short-subunit alcohol dehydrogenase family)